MISIQQSGWHIFFGFTMNFEIKKFLIDCSHVSFVSDALYSPPSKDGTTGKSELKDLRKKQMKSEKLTKAITKQTKVLVVDVRSSEEYPLQYLLL